MLSLTTVPGRFSKGRAGGGSGEVVVGGSGGVVAGAGSGADGAFSLLNVRLYLTPRSLSFP